MRAAGLPDREEPGDVGLPPVVDDQASVVVLGAHVDLQHLGGKVHGRVSAQVELVGRRVQVPQALDRGAEQNPRVLEVVAGLARQRRRVELLAHRVAAKVQEHPPPAQHRLAVDQQVYQRRTGGGLANVEGPLVALKEDHRQLATVVTDHLGEELPLVPAVGVGRHEAGQYLHVAARDVPAWADRSQPELPLCQVLAAHPCTVGSSRGAPLAVREHARGVDAGRPAGRVHDVGAAEQQERALCAGSERVDVHVRAQHEQPGHGPVRHDDVDHPAVVEDPCAAASDLLLQLLHHGPRGVRADRGCPAARVMVGLVADELPVPVLREGDPQVAQPQEGPGRHGGLGQRVVAVHGPAAEQGVGHLNDGVRFVAGQRQLVVGLLVRARVARGPGAHVVGDHDDVGLPELPEPVSTAEPGRAGADHHGVRGDHRHRPAGDLQDLRVVGAHSAISLFVAGWATRTGRWRELTGGGCAGPRRRGRSHRCCTACCPTRASPRRRRRPSGAPIAASAPARRRTASRTCP